MIFFLLLQSQPQVDQVNKDTNKLKSSKENIKNDTWGIHLNKKKLLQSDATLNKKVTINDDNRNQELRSAFTTNLREKLFSKAMLTSDEVN